jgi:hypothetical protein
MPTLNKKQLKSIKKKFKKNQLKIKDEDNVAKTTSISNKINRDLRNQMKNAMKKSVNISWNVSVGDLVYAKDPNSKDEIVGLVIKQNANITSSRHNKSELMNLGSVLVMTSRGKYLYQPLKLKKIYQNEE